MADILRNKTSQAKMMIIFANIFPIFRSLQTMHFHEWRIFTTKKLKNMTINKKNSIFLCNCQKCLLMVTCSIVCWDLSSFIRYFYSNSDFSIVDTLTCLVTPFIHHNSCIYLLFSYQSLKVEKKIITKVNKKNSSKKCGHSDINALLLHLGKKYIYTN